MRPSAAILSVGNEVLRGMAVNSNAAFLGRELSDLGFDVTTHTTCPDTEEAIKFHLGDLFRRTDVVILSGGLGPTPDDVTREGIAAYFNVPLIFSKAQFSRFRRIYKRFKKPVPLLVRREACYPANAKPLVNRFGIAVGFVIEEKGKLVIALPGVPSELINMYGDVVRPLLKKHYPRVESVNQLIVKMVGISEPDVMKKLRKDFFADRFVFGIYPTAGEIAIRVQADSRKVLKKIKQKISKRLQNFIYAWDDLPLARVVGQLLEEREETLAVAESCTGGLLSSEISRHAGTSHFFKGGAVAYHQEVKTQLGVDPRILRRHGEVSPEVAKALATAAQSRMNSTYGIGITGIAGPQGGSPKKPVGLVFIAWAGPGRRPKVWRHHFWGDRRQIQRKATVKALEYLWRKIREQGPFSARKQVAG
ncbi:MAG TPA: CinA family nicotinamide mononucleotide deamidase-related protein [Candidatus Omnitrophota bacterium]|nr:CinA family nicotinamide mononucleotide deamidase-related protein [Candidatus Omnitrophota bacterium]